MKKISFLSMTLIIAFNLGLRAIPLYYSGGTGSEGDPYQIASISDLITLSQTSSHWDKYFIQTADIDAASTIELNGGAGFSPIGLDYSNAFTGNYNGQDHSISNLYINRPAQSPVGLFGSTWGGGTIENLSVTNCNITGNDFVGALCGKPNGTISNCHSSGSVTGIGGTYGSAGGLLGYINSSAVINCSSSGTVSGQFHVGGLIGSSNSSPGVENCYSSCDVTGNSFTGGLIGNNYASTVSNCYSTGNVTRLSSSTASNVGGFCGYNDGDAISHCYSIGSVYYTDRTDPVDKGFLGSNSGGSYTSNFFDSEASNQTYDYAFHTNNTATPKSTAEMQTYTTFTGAGWDFIDETANGTDDTWGINPSENGGYPFLSWQGYTNAIPPVVTTQAASAISASTATGNGTITDLGTSNPTQHGVCWNTSGTPTISDSKTEDGAVSATGTFTSSITGLSAGTTYYVRAYATNSDGTSYGSEVSFTTSKLSQTITFGALATKTYGDADFDPGATASSELTVTYSSSDEDVASIISGKIHITGTGTCTINADQSGNETYNEAPRVSQSFTVNKKELTVTGASADNKVYDGNTNATISGASLVGVVSGDDVTIDVTTGSFADANVADGIAVTPALTMTGADAGNYTLTQPSGITANITAKELTVTAGDKSKVYGDANPAFTHTITGFVGSEDESVLATAPICSCTADETSDAGTYDITVAGGVDENYSFAYVKGTLTINKATQTITFDALDAVRDDAGTIELTATASSGLTVTYTSSDTDVATVSGSTVTILAAGTTTITASQDGSNNYEAAADVMQDLVVNSTVGITPAAAPEITIYPNPAHHILFIEAQDEGIQEIKVINMHGQMVLEKRCYSEKEHIELSGLPGGMYIIRIKSGDNTITKEIIKR